MSTRLESFLSENGLSCWVKFFPEERKWFAEIGIKIDDRCGECSGDSYLGKVAVCSVIPSHGLAMSWAKELDMVYRDTPMGAIYSAMGMIAGKEIICETEYYDKPKTIQVPNDLVVSSM